MKKKVVEKQPDLVLGNTYSLPLADEALRLLHDHIKVYHLPSGEPKSCRICRALRRSMLKGV